MVVILAAILPKQRPPFYCLAIFTVPIFPSMGVVIGVMGLAAAAVATAVGVASYIDYLENAKRQAKTWAESRHVQYAFAGELEQTKQCGTAMQSIRILRNEIDGFAPENRTRAELIRAELEAHRHRRCGGYASTQSSTPTPQDSTKEKKKKALEAGKNNILRDYRQENIQRAAHIIDTHNLFQTPQGS